MGVMIVLQETCNRLFNFS